MSRIVTWLLGTVAGVTLLFGYPTSTSGPAAASPAVATAPVTPGAAGAATGTGTASSTGTGRTVTGALTQTRWGPIQVAITVADGKVTAVDVPVYPNGNGRDREINADALPTLKQETLTAQNANIDMVSGATVTSQGYLTSLQSALDQAGV